MARTEFCLIILGTVSSIIHGSSFPILSIILGGMTTVFLRAQNSDFSKFSGTKTVEMGNNIALTPISRSFLPYNLY